MIHHVRVIFGDTDQMGVVYYANYLRWFEAARAAYWRSLGRTHADLDRWGVALPVVEAHCRYRRPAYYEDLIAIHLSLGEVRRASVRFDYRLYRANEPAAAELATAESDSGSDSGDRGELLADGWTRHAVVGPSGRPRAIPAEMQTVIARADDRGAE